MQENSINKYLLGLKNVRLSHPYGKELDVYSINKKMFAMSETSKKPNRISLRCDKRLATLLKEKYDEVMPGHKLNKDKWITIVASGQLSVNEIKDLITHSYLLVKDEDS